MTAGRIPGQPRQLAGLVNRLRRLGLAIAIALLTMTAPLSGAMAASAASGAELADCSTCCGHDPADCGATMIDCQRICSGVLVPVGAALSRTRGDSLFADTLPARDTSFSGKPAPPPPRRPAQRD